MADLGFCSGYGESMVKKIKKRIRRGRRTSNWLVPFDDDGQAAVYIHKHGDGDDHKDCGPVVMCCKNASDAYRAIAPALHERVETYQPQGGEHLVSWLESGVSAMYFVLCDPQDDNSVYQFGLPADEARELLAGRTPHSAYHHSQNRYSIPMV